MGLKHMHIGCDSILWNAFISIENLFVENIIVDRWLVSTSLPFMLDFISALSHVPTQRPFTSFFQFFQPLQILLRHTIMDQSPQCYILYESFWLPSRPGQQLYDSIQTDFHFLIEIISMHLNAFILIPIYRAHGAKHTWKRMREWNRKSGWL